MDSKERLRLAFLQVYDSVDDAQTAVDDEETPDSVRTAFKSFSKDFDEAYNRLKIALNNVK